MIVSTDVVQPMNILQQIQEAISTLNLSIITRVICQNTPRSTDNIQPEERFLHSRKCLTIDTIRHMIDRYAPDCLICWRHYRKGIDTHQWLLVYSKDSQKDGIGHLEEKVKMTTLRIKRPVVLDMPIFSDQDRHCDVYYYNRDILRSSEMPMLDLVYLAILTINVVWINYFMLNTILETKLVKS